MAKQDWGAIQKLFLAEYAKTKISPKEWCEANGYNYATARWHIKIPAQGEEKKAQNIAQGMPQKETAICAGYAPTNTEPQASILMSRPDVKARMQELRNNAALLVSFNAGHLAELSYKSAQLVLANKKFGQVAPNVKKAAQLTSIDMSTNKTEVNVDLAGLSYGKVCIVAPANCPADVWAAHMEKLREGKPTAQS